MSGAISSHGGLTRRSFLKATGAVAGAAAVTGVATPTLQALAADYESGQKESRFRPPTEVPHGYLPPRPYPSPRLPSSDAMRAQ